MIIYGMPDDRLASLNWVPEVCTCVPFPWCLLILSIPVGALLRSGVISLFFLFKLFDWHAFAVRLSGTALFRGCCSSYSDLPLMINALFKPSLDTQWHLAFGANSQDWSLSQGSLHRWPTIWKTVCMMCDTMKHQMWTIVCSQYVPWSV